MNEAETRNSMLCFEMGYVSIIRENDKREQSDDRKKKDVFKSVADYIR